MRVKDTLMHIKLLLLLVCSILSFTEHLYFSMRISACVFFTPAKNKIWTRYEYFTGIYKKKLQCDVTRLLSVVVMLLAFETFNVGSALSKIKTFCLYTNVINFFCNHFCDLLLGNFCKVFKTGPKVHD